MKSILILSLSLFMASCATLPRSNEQMLYDTKIFETADFIEHTEPQPMRSWLGRQLPYPPFEKLRKKLEETLGKPLLHRGEAHITVITPIEYDEFLSKKMSMARINEIAKSQQIQNANFEPICLGQGEANPDGKGSLQTYYIVVKSPELESIRKKIEDEFLQLGGQKDNFRATYWFPHITLGYTKRDLHLSDSVYKDEKSCLYSLAPEK